MSSFVRRSRSSDCHHVRDVTVAPSHLLNVETKVIPTSSLTHIRNVDGLALNRGKSDSNNQNEKKELHHCRIHQAGIIKVLSEKIEISWFSLSLLQDTTCVTWIG